MYATTLPSQLNLNANVRSHFLYLSDILIFVLSGPLPAENQKVSIGLGSSRGDMQYNLSSMTVSLVIGKQAADS